MQTCVYMSNRKIQVAVGNPKNHSIAVKRLYETEAPEGSIINGVITGEEELGAHLSQFWKENHLSTRNVCLVLHSSQFMAKTLMIPAMNTNKTLNYIQREFPGVNNDSGSVYGYFRISGNKGKGMREVFATRMERDFLDSYRKLFASVGIQINSVQAALGCVVSVLHQMELVRGKTCVVQIQDEDNLTSILLDKGIYCYSSVSRTFSEHGTEGYGMEVARNISGILQFASAQKLENSVTDVFWAGFPERDMRVCAQALEQMDPDLKADMLEDEKVIRFGDGAVDNFLFAVSGLFRLEKESNLYYRYKKSSESHQKRISLMKQLIPVLLLLVVMLMITGFFVGNCLITQKRLQEVRDYNENPEVLEQSAQYDELESRLMWNQTLKASLERAKRNIESYPSFNSSVRKEIESCSLGQVVIEVLSFDAATGIVNVDTVAPEVEDINQFIDRLEERDIFEQLDYTGYVWSEERGMWTINLVCYLSENAGK